MHTRIVLSAACLLLIGGVAVRGQAPGRLTLDEAIRLGIAASHRLAGLDARRDASNAAADSHVADDRPQVSVQAGYTRTSRIDELILIDVTNGNQPVTLFADVPDNLRTRLDLRWPIYTGGRSDALERAARAEARAIGHEREAAQADLKLEITRAYWALVTAAASAAVLEQSVARMDAHLADARSRAQAGLAPPTDVLSTEAQRSRQQMLLIEARNLEESARADLRRLVGLRPDDPIDVATALDAPAAPETTAAALAEEARANRPDRRVFEVRLEGADEQRAAAAAGRRPSLFLAGGYDYARPNPLYFPRVPEWHVSWDVGINATWSIWDGGRVKAQVAQAAANRRAVEAGLREFDAVLESDVRQARLALASSLAAVSAAGDAVRSATEARRVMASRYGAGLATNTDALDAQLALLQAELDRTRAVANARLAAARLDRVLGR